MAIDASVRTALGVWNKSGVRVMVKRQDSRWVLRIQLYRKVAVELRLSHALRLADMIVDAVEVHRLENPHETRQQDVGEELPNHEELDTHTATQGHENNEQETP